MQPPPTPSTRATAKRDPSACAIASPNDRARAASAFIRPRRASRALHSLEALRQVGDEVLGILEPDVQPDQRPARPRADAARLVDVVRHDEALEAAPAVAEREALEVVDERGELRVAAVGELHAEKAGGS